MTAHANRLHRNLWAAAALSGIALAIAGLIMQRSAMQPEAPTPGAETRIPSGTADPSGDPDNITEIATRPRTQRTPTQSGPQPDIDDAPESAQNAIPDDIRYILLSLEQEGLELDRDMDSISLDPEACQAIRREYADYKIARIPLNRARSKLLREIAETRFAHGEYEYHTFDVEERKNGAEFDWDRDRPETHAVRRTGFDEASGLGYCKIALISPGDDAEIDRITVDLKDLKISLMQRMRNLVLR